MFDRAFGVELECGVNLSESNRDRNPESGCSCSDDNGYYCDFCRWEDDHYDESDDRYTCDVVRDRLGEAGVGRFVEDVIHDGTDVEITTSGLKGMEGLENLKLLMEKVKNNLGGYTTGSDGTHIHIDAPDYANDEKLVERLGKTWLANSDHIYKTVSPDRVNFHYCPQFGVADLNVLLENRKGIYGRSEWYGSGERCDLNFEALDAHGSIEIRLHEGTLNYDEIRAWIIFMGTMIDTVANRSRAIPTVKSLNHLFTSLKLDRKTRAQLRRKAGITAVAA